VWRERLRAVQEKLLGDRHPGSAECLEIEVIDRSTEEAVRRFSAAGLLQTRIRATRHLYPRPESSMLRLSDEESSRVESHTVRFKRKLKMARILAAEELFEEARDAVRQAILSAACAAAVRARLREPEKLEETIISPVAACWGGCRPLIQRFVTEPDNDIEPVMSALQKLFA